MAVTPDTAESWQTHIPEQALTDWMDQKGLGKGPVEDAVLLGGGTQNLLLRFTRDGRDYVLRRPPPHLRANSNETMRREMRMLQALADTEVPHPRLIAGCPEETVIGAAFYLMEPVEGFTPVNGLPEAFRQDPQLRHRMGLALMEGIALLGAVDYRQVGLTDFGNPDRYLERQVGRWQSQLDSYRDFPGWPGAEGIPGVAQVARWLENNRPDGFEAGILHGDYHLANVMYRTDAPELAAIVDWELTTIGDPLLDLGWVLATWPEQGQATVPTLKVEPWQGFPSSDELIRHYESRSHRSLEAIDWYTVLACYKLGIILEGTYARACAGKAPKAMGELLHTSTVNLFERALSRIR